MEIQYSCSQHDDPWLFFDELDGQLCLLCVEKAFGSGYGCDECGVYMHKSCAELPQELHHPSHPKHPLHLMYLPPPSRKECDSCREKQITSKYNCSDCELNLCVKCTSLPLTQNTHVHDHPLTLAHKLTISFICDACGKEGKGMFYFCAKCSFLVHLHCIFLPLIQPPLIREAEIHNHPLTLVLKSISFICDACGKEGGGTFYFCATCFFVSHLDCACLPSIVKVIRHNHPLNLTYSLSTNQSGRKVCKLCVSRVDVDYGVYYCPSCDFVAHLHCATSKEDRDETFVPKSKDEESIESSSSIEDLGPDESIDSLAFVVKKIKLGVEGSEIAEEIKHFSHEHDLKLTNKVGINKKCNACMRSIFPPFYNCTQCGFFLHKACVELPRKIRHPLHQHPLILRSKATFCSVCKTCCRLCSGFTYNCEKCKFNIDVQCSLIPDTITHASHEHQLILSRSSDAKKCSCCDSDQGFKFCCADCEFALDFKCLTLPYTIKYEQHVHPFTLCYSPEDESDEYYCDICEKERDPKRWYYYCADCIFPAHPDCILGIFLNAPSLNFLGVLSIST
ncbi:hypothetical protein F2P56_023726 [Juglans regia]|uniref:Uncharacterized protein LOC109008056 n=2 Tax=Juglans regia TaxID=51240 RepID=A0A6P9EWE7_JUGRE|nr:uncharacterized protein LOC109008056 [Juglans regia]KAF5454028.1 hypothetical protein F2P56_023726 [Juglans regia]